ncbi:hypothetical protein [Congregicoccus parvus]|uniref:hypothetical protein n=1 Tax=Congregicoccus parvus TaxID=3081749 RepID=UPI003FA58B08
MLSPEPIEVIGLVESAEIEDVLRTNLEGLQRLKQPWRRVSSVSNSAITRRDG